MATASLIISLCFFRRSVADKAVVCGQNWPNFELIQTPMYVIVTCKCKKHLIKIKLPRKRGVAVSPTITLWELSVAMETRVLILSGSKPNAASFPHPNQLQIEIGCSWPAILRYSCLKVFMHGRAYARTHAHMHARTDASSSPIL